MEDKELKVLVALVSANKIGIGQVTPGEIYHLIDIDRSYVYRFLRRLDCKGLASYNYRGIGCRKRVNFYYATDRGIQVVSRLLGEI